MSDQVDASMFKVVKLLLSNNENSTEEPKPHRLEVLIGRCDPRRANRNSNVRKHPEGSLCHEVPNSSTSGCDDECLPPTPKRKMMSLQQANMSRDQSGEKNVNSEGSASTSKVSDIENLKDMFCIICKSSRTTSTNYFVRCEDCHNTCHKDCATLPIAPGFFSSGSEWYCSSCSCKKRSRTSSNLLREEVSEFIRFKETLSSENELPAISPSPSPSSSDVLRRKIDSSVANRSCASSSSCSTSDSTYPNYSHSYSNCSRNISPASSSSDISSTNSAGISPKICITSLCSVVIKVIQKLRPQGISNIMVKHEGRYFMVKAVSGELNTFHIELL